MDLIDYRLYWSDEAYKILGVTPEQCTNSYQEFLEIVHPDDVQKLEKLLENPSQTPLELEFRVIRPDGTVRNIFELVEFLFNEDGKAIYLYGTIQDITEKVKLEQSIKRKQKEIDLMQKRFEALVQKSTDVFEIISPDGTIEYISEASERVIGYKAEERIGRKIFEYYEGRELKELTDMVEQILNNPEQDIQSNINFKTKEGKKLFLEIRMQNMLSEPAVKGIVVNFRDISKRVEMEKKIAYLATYDQLTGLANRIILNEQLENKCQKSQRQAPFALIILDIDGFNYINSALGYSVGDQLLIEVAKKLNSSFNHRELIFHYSGDQFALIVHSLSTREEYIEVAKEIVRLFAQPFKVANYELNITVNMGISTYPKDSEDWEQLIKYAHIALLRAKNEGKNKYKFYASDIDIHNYKQFELRNDLAKAIAKGELRLNYQPIVNLKSNEILAVEALINWKHPSWGMIPAHEFTALAEDTGLIINIGKQLLREVCKAYKHWLSNGAPKIKMVIHISEIQLFEKDFVKTLLKTITDFGLEPDFLIIEITEKALMQKIDTVTSNIQKLQSSGIEIALGDFGTTCLSYLSSLNIDYLKVSSSFVNNISDKTNAVITKHIIKMTQDLGIKSIAVGIKNSEQLAYLQRLKCFSGQGQIFINPLPAEDFEKILIKKKCKPQAYANPKATDYEEKKRVF